MERDTRRNYRILFGFILLKFLLQYIALSGGYELHRDEFLHLDQARHLAWGFASVPPFTSWMSYLILLLGNGVFWVKFFPALFGALTLVLVWKSVEALGGGLFARSLAAMAFLFSVMVRINTLYQPNSPDIFFWTLAFYCIIRYIQSEKPVWLYLLAVSFAFGFLNKYNICFLITGLLMGLAVTKHRSLYKNPVLYKAMALALLLVLPNLIWQFRQGFPAIRHINELTSRQLVNIDRASFLVDQITFFFPAFFVLLVAVAGFIFYNPFRNFRIIGWSFIFIIGFYLFFQGKSYYALGLYPVLFAFGAVYAEHLTAKGFLYALRFVSVGVILGLGVVHILISTPLFSPGQLMNNTVRQIHKATGQLDWRKDKPYTVPQDYADMVGWRELAHNVDSAFRLLLPEEQERALVFCDNYGQAGAVNYYVTPYRGAVSFNADYKNWLPPPDAGFIALILVCDAYRSGKNEVREFPHLPFGKVQYIGEVECPIAIERGAAVYLLTEPTAQFTGAALRAFQ